LKSQRDEKNLVPDDEDFSDITDFRPERDAFSEDGGPVPMKEVQSAQMIQRPWVIAALAGGALIIGGIVLLLFLSLTKHQKTKMGEAESLVPQSQINVLSTAAQPETEVTGVSISEKTKAAVEETTPEETTEEPTESEEETEETTEAEESEKREVEMDDSVFLLEHGEATLLNCTTQADHMTFPDLIEGLPFEGVNDEAFQNCPQLITVVLPDSVCWIGARAFVNCGELSEVIVGANMSAISEKAFEGVENITLVAPAGSYAEEFAAEHGLAFRVTE